MASEESLALRLLVALAAALWAVLVPGQAGRFMDQPLRCPAPPRLPRPVAWLARQGARA
jgi:hypothetical protein